MLWGRWWWDWLQGLMLDGVLGWRWRNLFLGQELGAASEVRCMWTPAVAASWGLFTGFGTVDGRMITGTFNASWWVTTVTGTVAKTLAGKALGWSRGF